MNRINKYSFALFALISTASNSFLNAAAPSNLRAENIGYISVDLYWQDNSNFGDLQILQRKKSNETQFKTVVRFPHKADFYIDLGLESNTTYNYRLATREDNGISSWVELTASTKVNPHTGVFNVRNYGAKGDGKNNDTAAIRQAIADASKNGGTVFFPAGTYAVAPDPQGGRIFYLEKGNIFLKGEGPDKSIISCYVSGLRNPETSWDYSSDGNLVRGTAFILNGEFKERNDNFVFEDLRVTGNARPTGDTLWWSNQQMEQGWDITHKGIYLGKKNGNVYMKNCVWDNFRGEIIYSGDPWTAKLKMVDCKIYGCNSSAISTSADFEAVNIEVWDAANACVESAFFHNLNGIPSPQQNCIIINSRFRARGTMLSDKNSNPVLTKTDSGKSNLALFNSPDCYMIIDNCRIENSYKWGVMMDVGQRNFTIVDSVFEDCGSDGFIYFETKDKADYNLTGKIENFLVENSTFIANKNALIWYTANYTYKQQKDILFKNNYVELRGGKSIIHYDAHQWDDWRENFVFDGNKVVEKGGLIDKFSWDVKIAQKPAIKPVWKDNNEFPIPSYYENGGQTQYELFKEVAGPQPLIVHGPYVKIHDLPANKITELEMGSYKNRYPEGFNTQILRSSNNGRALIRSNSNWNDFPQDIYLDKGNSLKVKKQDSLILLTELNGKKVLSFRNQGYFHTSLSENGNSVYGLFTGVQDGQQVSVVVSNPGVIIEHNDKINLSENKSFVLSGSPVELKFIKSGAVLIEIDRQDCPLSLVTLY